MTTKTCADLFEELLLIALGEPHVLTDNNIVIGIDYNVGIPFRYC